MEESISYNSSSSSSSSSSCPSKSSKTPSYSLTMSLSSSHPLLVICLLLLLPLPLVSAQYRPQWVDPMLSREIFVLNLEDGYFGCQVNDSTDFLQLFELSKLCDGTPQCFRASDELSVQLKCTDRSEYY